MKNLRGPWLASALCGLVLAACAGKTPAPAPSAPTTAPVAPANGPPASGVIRLLVRGDDMGATHGINVGHIEAYRNGIMRSAEVIVPGPWFPEAVKLLQEHPEIDVGIHLALTSEWTLVKWRPLTHAPSLVDADGYFFPMIWASASYPKTMALREQPYDLAQIEAELRAQIELLRRHLPRLSHGGCHMGCGSLGPAVQAIIDRLLREYGLARDTSGLRGIPIAWPKERAARDALTGAQRADLFADALERLEAGDYLFVEHPATDDPEMRAVHHIGYENVAEDRAGVVAMWTSARVKEIVARRRIQLITYLDLPLK